MSTRISLRGQRMLIWSIHYACDITCESCLSLTFKKEIDRASRISYKMLCVRNHQKTRELRARSRSDCFGNQNVFGSAVSARNVRFLTIYVSINIVLVHTDCNFQI